MSGRVTTWILVLGALIWGAQSASSRNGVPERAPSLGAIIGQRQSGIWWFAVGLDNTRLVVQLSPPSSDTAGCDSVIATLLVRQDFLRDAYYNHGFRQIQCQIMNEDGHTTGDIVRNIIPPAPEPPATSPKPHTVPRKHLPSNLESSCNCVVPVRRYRWFYNRHVRHNINCGTGPKRKTK